MRGCFSFYTRTRRKACLPFQNNALLQVGAAVLSTSCLYGYCFRVLTKETLYAPILAQTSSLITTALILLGGVEVVCKVFRAYK